MSTDERALGAVVTRLAMQLNDDPRDSIHVARQPIFDKAERVFGYELLYRAFAADATGAASRDLAAARVLTDACLSLGLGTLTMGRQAFFNFTRRLLLSCAGTLLPSPAAVLELCGDIDVDAEVIDACRNLHGMGYAIALDDFKPWSGAEALLPFAKYVKVDVSSTSADARTELAKRLRPRGLRLVADNVETQEVEESVRAAGYDLVQGFYFCRPRTVSARSLSGRRSAHLRLLAALNRPDVTVNKVEELIKDDASLVFRVLRSVNSAAFAAQQEITSIREAVLLLGLDQIRKWVSVWAMAGVNSGGTRELTTLALQRARSCEFLGDQLSGRDSGWFLLGLCSLLDAMLGRPMEQALADLPISTNARKALLGRPGMERSILDAVIAYERGAWDDATRALEPVGLSTDLLAGAYGDALRWTKELADDTAAAA